MFPHRFELLARELVLAPKKPGAPVAIVMAMEVLLPAFLPVPGKDMLLFSRFLLGHRPSGLAASSKPEHYTARLVKVSHIPSWLHFPLE